MISRQAKPEQGEAATQRSRGFFSSFSGSSLRVRLILLGLLAILPALGYILYDARTTRVRSMGKIEVDMITLVKSLASDDAQVLEGGRQLLVALQELPAVKTANPGACSGALAELLTEYPDYTNFTVNDLSGDVFCSAVPLSAPVNTADRPWFQKVLSSRDFAVGDFQVGRITGRPVIVLAYPLFDLAGQLQGVITAALDLNAFHREAATDPLSEETTMIGIDDQGTVILHQPNPEEWVGVSMLETSLVRTILTRQEGVVELPDVEGIERLYAFAPVGEAEQTGLYLAIGVPTSVAFAEIDRVLRRDLTWLGIIAVAAAALTWVGSDRFVLRSVKALVEATERLGEDLTTRSGLVSDRGELGQLARAFDGMAERLEQREAERDELLEAEARARAEAEATRERLAFLLDLSTVLASSLDYETTLQSVARLALPVLADFCTVYVIEDGQNIYRVAEAHIEAEKEKLLHDLYARCQPGPEYPGSLVGRVARTGEPVFMPEIDRSSYDVLPPDDEIRRMVSALDPQSAISMPLAVQERLLGVITFIYAESGRRYNQSDLALAREVARRVALAVNQARLYQEAREEIKAREEAEARLNVSLQEKDTLLKEVYHRVKNNLQAVSNLLYLQSNYIQDEEVREMFRNTQDRIKSIALVHEKLYKSETLTQVDFASYIESLAANLILAYGYEPDVIQLSINIEPIPLTIEQAIPLGIIVNELVSNALKHAFSPGTGQMGEIRIELRADAENRWVLTVSDNGAGFPADLDLSTATSLGLNLVYVLTLNMGGTVDLIREGPGAAFVITLPPAPVDIGETV